MDTALEIYLNARMESMADLLAAVYMTCSDSDCDKCNRTQRQIDHWMETGDGRMRGQVSRYPWQ